MNTPIHKLLCRAILVSIIGTGVALAADKPTVSITNVASWSSSNITTHIAARIIQDQLHYPVKIIDTEAGPMWAAVATGRADATLTAWLPVIQKSYWQRYKHQVVNLGPITKGTWAGLAVPDYVPVHSLSQLEQYHQKFHDRIVGIGSGAGVMITTQKAIESYGMRHMRLLSSSTPAMEAELKRSIAAHRWIVVTAWTPLSIWARFHLRELSDPKNVYGKPGNIDAVINPKLEKKAPQVVAFLRQFYISIGSLEKLMNERRQGASLDKVVQQWIKAHQSEITSWVQKSRSA
ncbi:glycine betaine ABC transporter substrate-binding protein [Acidithiobacillus sp.]|uniref:glycine betaine ABC transporter substrate-binding protein n=1 Tax=Acidithiobacillus sp. TaxID=1872118 RepID=UPI0025BD4D71|nr:glycine betaine ABC transporter substrate-binding protein [Acidithiobacillus sp.]